jgi:hypothetical protein
MKKSMLALFGCALVAGSVMAAEVTGNNTAVVIQKDAVVSDNLFQFLIVPVKGFDIAAGTEARAVKFDELFPVSLYDEGTNVYAADGSFDGQIRHNGAAWTVASNASTTSTTSATAATILSEGVPAGTILWMKSPAGTVPGKVAKTVFCGELLTTEFKVTIGNEALTPFGNATSEAKTLGALKVFVGETESAPSNNDVIFVLQKESSEYARFLYNGGQWLKEPEGDDTWEMLPANDVEIAAGEAAYYYRTTK